MDLKIKDILNCTNGNLIIGDIEKTCIDFSRDTRTLKKGDTYIGMKGDDFDGSLLWEEALENGADIVLMNKYDIDDEKKEKYSKQEKCIIQVDDTKKALIQIATLKREMYKDLFVVGVTGSVGKTSTKDIIANVLSKKYKTLKTEGNYNNSIGLPLTLLNLKDHEVAVIEMGMNHLGEISELSKIAKPNLSVITNVGTSHIGNLGSRENILKAKLEILDGMKEKILVINNDNDMLSNWAENNKNSEIKIYTFGVNNKSNCTVTNIQYQENGSKFVAKVNGEELNIEVPVGGEVFVINALCAILVGKILNLSNLQIAEGIKTFELTKKRMEIIKKGEITIINDTYNASFDSMKASIEYLSRSNAKRKIAVLGDMFELGDFSEELHRKVGKVVAESNIDNLFIIGKDAKYIAEEAKKASIPSEYFSTNDELLKRIKEVIKAEDIILFKASNGMKLFEVVEKLTKDM